MAYKLSIIIPARQEVCYDIDLLHETLNNLLENTTDACQIVIVLDGYWPPQPIPAHPRVTVIHHNQSIGQRAATNEGARIASGEWICKLDAHCAVDKDFDVKLLEGMEPHWAVVPGQYNLLAFVWKCKKCGTEKDQGPKPAKCGSCNSRYLKQVKIWKPRDGKEGRRTAYTHSWRFDSNLDFQYYGAYAADERYCKKHGVPFRPETQGTVHDTMSLLGACWAMTRERYFYLEPCDEQMGSWGDMGTEISAKVWLSGGELKVNRNTWFAHFFRVGGLGFPYEGGGRKERAKARGRELWLKNRWPKQIYPLSWLIERFKPLPDWHSGNNPVLDQVNAAGKSFRSSVVGCMPSPTAFPALSHSLSAGEGDRIGQQVPSDAMGLPGVNDGGNVTPLEVLGIGNQLKVQGVAAPTIPAEMIQDGDVAPSAARQRLDQPRVDNTVNQGLSGSISSSAVSGVVESSGPVPASVGDIDTREQANDVFSVQGNGEILLSSHDSASSAELRSGSESRLERDSDSPIVPRKLLLYYTCCSHDPLLEEAARANLRRSTNGHEIGCVSLQRTDFGDWTIVLDREKSGGTMHYQILAGLERSTADYVFLCESDVLYHRSHFEFTPPDDSVIYYNTNVWRVRWEDGHAVRTDNLQQVSGICASRQLLLDHYRKRVQLIEQNGGKFDVRRMAYEPGTRGDPWGVKIANWSSEFPNLDITGHGQTLTQPHFSIDSFRNKKYAEGWQETDQQIEGWPLIAGRVQEWLREMVDGSNNG